MPDFEEIYQTYFADVYRYILALSRDAHTAEEVTQETFFRALASIDQFRGDCQLRVWLCQIARNQYLSLCRERKHRGELEQEPGDDRRCSPCGPSGSCPLPRSGSSSARRSPGPGSPTSGPARN